MPSSSLRVASFNIRTSQITDDPLKWNERRHAVVDFLGDLKPDVIGLQELSEDQRTFLIEQLLSYECAGLDPNERTDEEYCPIFFAEDQLERLDEGTFWLSEEPDVPGSIGWDGQFSRFVNWVKLNHRQTNQSLYCYNTHFDHAGPKARVMSAHLLTERIKEYDYPLIVTGDLNCEPDSSTYQVLTSSLEDAYERATDRTGPPYTFPGFNPQKPDLDRIDYILADEVSIQAYTAHTPTLKGYYLSDHLPISATFTLP